METEDNFAVKCLRRMLFIILPKVMRIKRARDNTNLSNNAEASNYHKKEMLKTIREGEINRNIISFLHLNLKHMVKELPEFSKKSFCYRLKKNIIL